MNLKDALDLMLRQTDLRLVEKDAIYCYGISKMTVVNEQDQGK